MRARAAILIVAAGCADATTTIGGGAARFDAGTSAADAGGVDGAIDRDGAAPPPSDASSANDASPALGPLVAYASGYAPTLARFAVGGGGALGAESDVASFGASPSFLAIAPDATALYAIDENATGQVGAYAIDRATGALTFGNAVSSGGNGPAFVGLDGSARWVFVANYGDGTVSVLQALGGGRIGPAVDTLSAGANAHMIAADPSNHFVFVPCKGADYVAQYLFDASDGGLTPNAVPHVATAAGAGPRHIAFHPNGAFAYVINETASTITAYALDKSAGTLREIETKSTLPAGFTGTNTGAEVRVHPSGAWVVGSNRGDDSLVVFAIDASSGKLTLASHTKTGGTTPRAFAFDPTGNFIDVANQGSGTVTVFRFDATNGSLAPIGAPVAVTSASFVQVVRLPAP